MPLILFSTSSEFWQQNVIPGAAQEGVGAFAEPSRSRMVMPIDEPSDLLYRLITHELTHVFQFDIIPTGLIRRNMPLWTMEGMSDYMTGYWRPLDMMTVRDAAVCDIVPKMSEMQDYGGFSNPRLIYNLGHAAFEFMEARWGKEGVRAYVFALRRSVIGGSDDAYQEAFQMSARGVGPAVRPLHEGALQAVPRQGAAGRLRARPGPGSAQEPLRQHAVGRAIAVGRSDCRHDRQRPRPRARHRPDLDEGRRDHPQPDERLRSVQGLRVSGHSCGRWNSVPWMSWSPTGDRLAYFVRTEKDRSLIVQNVITRKIEVRVPLMTVDAPESPDFSPDGKLIAFSGMRNSRRDIFTVNLETKEISNLTKDDAADYAPTWSPDGKSLVYLSRVSGNEKLFRMNADGTNPNQLTFGTHDEGGPQFWMPTRWSSPPRPSTRPSRWNRKCRRTGRSTTCGRSNLKTNELKQYTDALAGNLSPVVLRDADSRGWRSSPT